MKHCLVVIIALGLCVSGLAQTGRAVRGDGAQCTALPCVVASVSLTNQSQKALQIPLFTPSSDGLYRVSAYMRTSTGTNQRASWQLTLGWTDELGTNVSGSSIGPDSFLPITLVVRDIGGQPLAYSVKPHGGGQGVGMTYDLFVTVEQVQ